MRPAHAVLGGALLAAGSAVLAQQPAAGVRVIGSHQISSANPKLPHLESHLAIDPRDSKHMIACSWMRNAKYGVAAVYVTFDGGAHWSPSRPAAGVGESVFNGGDALVYFDERSTPLFLISGEYRGEYQQWLSRSSDGGRTWNAPAQLPRVDRQFLAIDRTDGPLHGRMYVTGNAWAANRDGGRTGAIVLSRSDDGGRTFQNDLILRDEGGSDPTAAWGAVPMETLVTPEGAVAIPYLRMPDPAYELERGGDSVRREEIGLLISDDGGRTFAGKRPAYIQHSLGGYGGARGYRHSRAQGAERAVVDGSRSQYRGRIYMVWPDYDLDRGRYVVRVVQTNDLGKTWSSTIVNDNTQGGEPGNPAIAVNNDGVIAVTWNDRRDDPKESCWRLYGAISIDGGEHFLPNAKLSEAPSCPNTPDNWNLTAYPFLSTDNGAANPMVQMFAMIPVRWPNGGDTQGLSADDAGNFHAAWINGGTGTLQLWHTALAVDPKVVAQIRAARSRASTSGAPVATRAEPALPAGCEDVSTELTLDVTDGRLDFTAHTLTITMRLMNPTGRAVRGPVRAIVKTMVTQRDGGMGLANLHAVNADSGGTGIGATWTFDVGPTGLLGSKAKTPPRTVRFGFEGGVPDMPEGYFSPTFWICANGPTR